MEGPNWHETTEQSVEHETFGKIVAALRKEQVDFTTGRRWSQQRLADRTGLTKRIVSKIERGRQARLDGEVLQELAGAFELTSLERREFFAAASQAADREVVRADLDHREVFERAWISLGAVGLPAFLMDAFGNVVGVNRAMVAFHGCNVAQLNAAKSTEESANLLGMLLAPDAPLRRVLGNGWHSKAMTMMRQWRAMTLRYRHTERYLQLYSALAAFPDFPIFWSASREQLQDVNSRLRSHIYTHRIHGPVGYTVFTDISLSGRGDLYLSTYVPQDPSTIELFQRLAGDSQHALRLAPWP